MGLGPSLMPSFYLITSLKTSSPNTVMSKMLAVRASGYELRGHGVPSPLGSLPPAWQSGWVRLRLGEGTVGQVCSSPKWPGGFSDLELQQREQCKVTVIQNTCVCETVISAAILLPRHSFRFTLLGPFHILNIPPGDPLSPRGIICRWKGAVCCLWLGTSCGNWPGHTWTKIHGHFQEAEQSQPCDSCSLDSAGWGPIPGCHPGCFVCCPEPWSCPRRMGSRF